MSSRGKRLVLMPGSGLWPPGVGVTEPGNLSFSPTALQGRLVLIFVTHSVLPGLAALASPRSLKGIEILKPMEPNLHFNKLPRRFPLTWKFRNR